MDFQPTSPGSFSDPRRFQTFFGPDPTTSVFFSKKVNKKLRIYRLSSKKSYTKSLIQSYKDPDPANRRFPDPNSTLIAFVA